MSLLNILFGTFYCPPRQTLGFCYVKHSSNGHGSQSRQDLHRGSLNISQYWSQLHLVQFPPAEKEFSLSMCCFATCPVSKGGRRTGVSPLNIYTRTFARASRALDSLMTQEFGHYRATTQSKCSNTLMSHAKSQTEL